MTTLDVMMYARQAMITALFLVSPFLAVAALVSLVMGLFQASVRMTDLTLSFVPRFIAVMLVVWFTASWVGTRMLVSIERGAVAMRTVVE